MAGPIILEKDNKDVLPPRANAGEWAPWGAPARPALIDWRVAGVLCAFLLIAGWLLAPAVGAWLGGWGAQVIRIVVYGSLALAGLAGLKRLALVDQPGGFRLFFWQVARAPGDYVVAGMLDVQRQYAANATRNVAALTLTNPAPALLPAPEEAEIVEAGPDVGPLPIDQWLRWLDQQPHALFAAQTGGGKSTIARAGLKPRIAGGESVFVIDPHSNGWFALPGVGGGENWREIEDAMLAVHALYRERLAFREAHKKETGVELDQHYFPRLTVVLDEANDARKAFDRLYAGSRKRESPWTTFAETLGSGARKVGISIWLLAQSALVEDIGLTSAMRQNFTRFALDSYTIRQMVDHEERQPDRRKAIYAALPGLSYPATAIIKSEVYLLDRAGLDSVSPPANSQRAAWDGWDYGAGRPVGARAQLGPVFPPGCDTPLKQIAYLRRYHGMSTRDIQAAVRCDYNFVCKVCRVVDGKEANGVK